MNKRKKLKLDVPVRLTLCCALALQFSACATATRNTTRVHQARNQFQSKVTYVQGIGLGAVIGAVAGAALGGLQVGGGRVGWNPRGAATGAAIGGLSGGTLGGLYAHQKVQQRRYYQGVEGTLDEAIARASTARREATQFNEVLSEELRSVRADARSQRAALNDARAVAQSLNGEIRQQQSNLAQARNLGVSPAERDRLESEIVGLQAERRQLEGYIDRLAPTRRPGQPVLP